MKKQKTATEVSKTKEDAMQDQMSGKPLDDTGRQEDKMKKYQTAAKCVDISHLVLRRFNKVDNELRTPVTKEELVAEVARQLCVSIHPNNLHLPSPLPSLGEYEVPLRLPREIPLPEGRVQWTLNVKIRRK